MEKFFSKVLGVVMTGGAFQIACRASGHTGAAAVTSALASFGRKLGMKGGVVTLAAISAVIGGILERAIALIFKGVVKQLCREGESQEEIFSKIDGYHISSELKLKLKETSRQYSFRSIKQ